VQGPGGLGGSWIIFFVILKPSPAPFSLPCVKAGSNTSNAKLEGIPIPSSINSIFTFALSLTAVTKIFPPSGIESHAFFAN
jgi:hypothetical protein